MNNQNKQLDHSDHIAIHKKYPLILLLHNFEAPSNVGSIFRLSDALGVEKIILTGHSPVPPNSKIKKTSRSTEKYVSYEYQKNPYIIIDQLKNEGFIIVCLEITEKSIDLKKFTLKDQSKVCVIVGSENKGVDKDIIAKADITVHIPMLGQNSSMNVATACSIVVYEIIKFL